MLSRRSIEVCDDACWATKGGSEAGRVALWVSVCGMQAPLTPAAAEDDPPPSAAPCRGAGASGGRRSAPTDRWRWLVVPACGVSREAEWGRSAVRARGADRAANRGDTLTSRGRVCMCMPSAAREGGAAPGGGGDSLPTSALTTAAGRLLAPLASSGDCKRTHSSGSSGIAAARRLWRVALVQGTSGLFLIQDTLQ